MYKSMYKGKQGLRENKQKQLFKIIESLRILKKKLREEDGDTEDLTGAVDTATEDTASPEAIAKIIDDVEGLVINAIETLGATNDVTTELIGTAGTLETLQDEEEMMAAIDASAKEAESIQEEFEPVYDAQGNIVNYSPENMDNDDFDMDDDLDDFSDNPYEDDLLIDDDFGVDDYSMDDFSDEDDYRAYESFSKKKLKSSKVKVERKFNKKDY